MGAVHQQHQLEEDIHTIRYRDIQRVTLIGSAVDLLLGVGKIFFGVIAHSQALIADGVHSLSDLATDLIVLWAAKHAHAEADAEHPYGHGRIETVATVGLGVSLLIVSIGIAYDAISRLFEPDSLLQPGVWALVIAGVSVVSKEVIYHYTMHVAKRLRSNMLKANAWHSRSDAISSIVVMIGVAGAMAGLDYLDAIAAVLVAMMIAKIAWDLAWHSIRELVDTALDADRVAAIRESIIGVDGVQEVHELRTRRMGGDALVDVHVQVGSRLSISEGHHIAEAVRNRVINDIEEVYDVMVHIDPEDDEQNVLCSRLPLRGKVMQRLHKAWGDIAGYEKVQRVTLHYLNGLIDVEIVLPLSVLDDVSGAQSLQQCFENALEGDEKIRSVRLYFA